MFTKATQNFDFGEDGFEKLLTGHKIML